MSKLFQIRMFLVFCGIVYFILSVVSPDLRQNGLQTSVLSIGLVSIVYFILWLLGR